MLDNDGHNVFKEIVAPDEAVSIAEVELILHKEDDEILDLLKGKK